MNPRHAYAIIAASLVGVLVGFILSDLIGLTDQAGWQCAEMCTPAEPFNPVADLDPSQVHRIGGGPFAR